MSGWRVGVDVGGTFTDIALVEESTGRVGVYKVPTIVGEPVSGVLDGVREGLRGEGLDPADVIYFGAGSTLAVNTIIQRTGEPTGLLVTEGFRDVLEIRRTRLPDAPSFEAARPVPLVRRAHVREVRERIGADGTVLRPFEPASVAQGVEELLDAGVSAVAVSFLHSYINPVHEREAQSVIAERWPDLFVCASWETWPQQREYERTLVCVMNAYVGSTMRSYYRRLEEGLRAMGIACPVLITQSNGGTVSIAEAARIPVRTMLSGPASGVMAAAKSVRESGEARLFTLDMGGTSADMSLIDGQPRVSVESTIGDFPLFLPAVAIETIGAGGGSIAWVDAHGVLKVGPRSAGADPGPACYDRGGREPTVTDAYLISGILGENDLLGGRMTLSKARAEDAIGELGEALGMGTIQAAEAVLRVATANMVASFLPMIARYGVDHREYSLQAYGGAGPTHAFLLAAEAGIQKLIIPPAPGAMCAVGAAVSDVQMDFVRSVRTELSDEEGMEEMFSEMEKIARKWLSEQGLEPGTAEYERSADMRYKGQSFEIMVGLNRNGDSQEAFHRRYEETFGYRDPDTAIEVLQIRMLARAPNQMVGNPSSSRPGESDRLAPVETREVTYQGNRLAVPVYRRAQIPTGPRLSGPAVLLQYDTTVFVTPGFAFRVDESGNLHAEAAG